MLADEKDVVVIGSGPAGVSAATVLVSQGLLVTMIEAGQEPQRPRFMTDWTKFRTEGSQQFELVFGNTLDPFSARSARSPKLSVEWFADLVKRSRTDLAYAVDGFEGAQVAAVGGMSTAWGAGLSLMDSADIAGWPVSLEELVPHYHSVARRIGISGKWPGHLPEPDWPIEEHPGLHIAAQHILKKSARKTPSGVELAVALQAVQAADGRSRSGCDLSGHCLHGCERRAIWSAEYDVEALKRQPGFELLGGTFVQRSVQMPDGKWALELRRGTGETAQIVARRLVSAAGAIGSARLVDLALGREGQSRRLLSSPTAAFALVMPEFFGHPWSDKVFALSQLSLKLAIRARQDYVYGYLFSSERLPISMLESASPFGFRGTFELFREIAPASLLGNLFFDGCHSNHTVEIRGDVAHVKGGFGATLGEVHKQVGPALRRSFLPLGAIPVPFRPALAAPGSDLHFAGTIPMRKTPATGEAHADGSVAGLRNFIVVDGSLLPSLPPKSHTFTIMANAERIAHHWARDWK